jgi:hypothetical protein
LFGALGSGGQGARQYPADPDANSFPAVPAGFGVRRGDCFHPNAAGAAVARESRRLGF